MAKKHTCVPIVLLLVAGCTLAAPTRTTPVTAATPGAATRRPDKIAPAPELPFQGVADHVLTNTNWTLTSFGEPGAETSVITDTHVSLKFTSPNKVAGSAGCNHYSGTYQVQGNTVSFINVGSTLMACSRISVSAQEEFRHGMMWQEDQYLAALSSTGTFTLMADSLTIAYSSGKQLLHFTRGAPGR